MPSTFSEKFVIMPKNAATHIQNTAPGPPRQIAADTPAMLPVPIVAARAVQRAWNCDTLPFSPLLWLFLSKTPPPVFFHQCPTCVIWKNLVTTVIRMPVPMSSIRPIFTHTNELIMSLISVSLVKNSSIWSVSRIYYVIKINKMSGFFKFWGAGQNKRAFPKERPVCSS